jgi:hypothetical protein
MNTYMDINQIYILHATKSFLYIADDTYVFLSIVFYHYDT